MSSPTPLTCLFSLLIGSGLMTAIGTTATAQTSPVSPTLLIESGPSDNPAYRRMVFVKYLSGERVDVAYKAYNRTEFIQIANDTPASVISACANGPATTLRDLDAFKSRENAAKRQSAAPEITRFCIKGVQDWDSEKQSRYLDPIFDGMPYAASLNN